MDQLSRDYAGRAHFLFVYVREAHPDDFPDHREHHSIEQKYQHARDMQKRHDTPRKIMVDSLDGDVHRQYGGLPNMSWVIDHTGHIAYKAGWTIESDIRPALENVFRMREVKREASRKGLIHKQYYREEITAMPTSRQDPTLDPESVEKAAEKV